MDFLYDILSRNGAVKDLTESLGNGASSLLCTGLGGISKVLVAAAVLKQTGKKITVITEDEATAEKVKNDFLSLGLKALVFPSYGFRAITAATASKEYEIQRIDTLSEVTDGEFDVLIMSVTAAAEYTVPKAVLLSNRFFLQKGGEFSQSELIKKLINCGYKRCDSVEGRGQFAQRGGIVDIFSAGEKEPYRIEFWGDEVDSIAFFDTETQRRTEETEKIKISPVSENVLTSEEMYSLLKEYSEKAKKLTSAQKESLYKDMEECKAGISIPFDRYLPLIYPQPTTALDYSDGYKFVFESGNVAEKLKDFRTAENEDIKENLEKGYLSGGTSKLSLTDAELFSRLRINTVFADSFTTSAKINPPEKIIPFTFRTVSPWQGDGKILKEDLAPVYSAGQSAVILAGEERAGKLLAENLTSDGIPADFVPRLSAVKKGITVTLGSLSSGFEMPEENFRLISLKRSGFSAKKPKKHKAGKTLGSLDELKKGDLVVHASHGIGVFDGINTITNAGVVKDYIKIKYQGSDVLYVPVTQLDLVSKYIGADNGVKINKLGNSEWKKTKARVRKAVKDMAKQLTELYAKRMSVKGHAFSPDTDLQNDFERRFEYEETEDQLRTAEEIKRDMERAVPMDRLLCGDVGFGKTEVALRAAFKCISEGKQCALLVPTTILAWQHYNTALRRFGDIPVTVKLLSRFVSPKEQKAVVKGLKDGRVDMVIGTHRLISGDVEFKDLGLVIIDEEQRFGVAQKERLKEKYPRVDVLTLSATPIPRTLNMAMSGLRDMSSIETSPGDRYPVQTYILEENRGVIKDAVARELRRGGQVYYLYNRVETIMRKASLLKEDFPDARISVAHGQMSEDELSDIWKSMVDGETDILVCTTIIETGIDVPNVNTLIIEDADRMGLSQLHQLRGRVGRSSRRAYAYFCYKRNKVLNPDAVKRLDAIRDFTEFGSGFKIALRDLEIRGAGSILGGEQHGNMEAVGYDMYIKLLNEAVINGEDISEKEEETCTVDLNVSAHIPESYIPYLSDRLDMYKRIAAVSTDEDVSDVLDELCDRFSSPPASVTGLIDIALLRNKSDKNGIYEISREKNDIRLSLKSIDTDAVSRLSDALPGRVRLSVKDKPFIFVRMKNGQSLTSAVKEIATAL